MRIITDERCLGYSAAGHPERPARISDTLAHLRKITDLPLEWLAPVSVQVDDEVLRRAHKEEYLENLQNGSGDFDGDTPRHPEIDEHARRAVGGALMAFRSAMEGQAAFSLLRPPGHHATRSRAMGFCYLNSMAITVLTALAEGVKRVAVLDFDVHHGNGTEAILVGRPGTAFHSIHQHPCYPGTGTEKVGDNCFNYPLPPRTPRAEYRKTLEKALADLASFKPDLVGVSAGFDAYARDPLAQETLEAEDFHWLGERISGLDIPFFSLLEGGYSQHLPELVEAYLRGAQGQ